jgi:hypothetical protein
MVLSPAAWKQLLSWALITNENSCASAVGPTVTVTEHGLMLLTWLTRRMKSIAGLICVVGGDGHRF